MPKYVVSNSEDEAEQTLDPSGANAKVSFNNRESAPTQKNSRISRGKWPACQRSFRWTVIRLYYDSLSHRHTWTNAWRHIRRQCLFYVCKKRQNEQYTFLLLATGAYVKAAPLSSCGRQGERYNCCSFLTSVSVTPRPLFTPVERTTGTHWIGGWVGLRSGLDTEARRKIFCHHRGSNPGRPACSQKLYWLSYPAPMTTILSNSTCLLLFVYAFSVAQTM
jgi:hypothetical protein